MDFNEKYSEVKKFFTDYVNRYIIKDLEKLDSIEADDNGIGGCTIPQANAAFTAVDLMGFLLAQQPRNEIKMSLQEFLSNTDYFPQFPANADKKDALDNFRDEIRSPLTHRFGLSMSVAKSDEQSLFVRQQSETIFNVRYFTLMVVDAIKEMSRRLDSRQKILNNQTFEETVQQLFVNISRLVGKFKSHSDFQTTYYAHLNSASSSTTTQTTQSMAEFKKDI